MKKNLDRHAITRLIEAEPTKSWNPDERHPVGHSNRTRITEWGKWYLTSKRDNTELNTKLEDLLNSLTSDLENWKKLTSKYDTWIDIEGYMENWNRGFSLKPEIMKMLSQRNLEVEVVFDIYYDGEDGITTLDWT